MQKKKHAARPAKAEPRSKPARGRPREYDERDVRREILREFWRNGLAATSLDTLAEKTGLSKPSLYALIGSKNAAYKMAIQDYIEQFGLSYLDALHGKENFREGLIAMYDAFIAVLSGEYGPGCPIACSLPGEAGADPHLKDLLAEILLQQEKIILKRVKHAQSTGEVNMQRDARHLASMIADTMLALSIRSRSGATASSLKKSSRNFVHFIMAG